MAGKSIRAPVAGRLRQAIESSGLSLNQIGQRAGIDHSRLSRFMRAERDLTLESVEKLCQVLGLQLTEIGATPGETPPAPAPAAAPAARGKGKAPSGEKPAPRKRSGK